MTNTTIPNIVYPIANGGVSTNPFVDIFNTRDPTSNDTQYPVQKKWLNTESNSYWILSGFTTSAGIITANWEKISAGSVFETLTGNTGPAVPPNANNINVVGDGTYVTTAGNASSSTLTITVTGAITTLYSGNSGTATPSMGTLQIVGSGLISTSASGNTITITSSGEFPWNNITGTTANMSVNNGYLANNASLVTLTLPATAAQFSIISVAGWGSGGWQIAQNSGQQIQIGVASTTSGATGYLASTQRYNCVQLLCTVANTDFLVLNSMGNIKYN